MKNRAETQHEVTVTLDEGLYQDLKKFMGHVGVQDDSKGLRRALVQFLRGLDGVSREEQ